MMKALGYLTLNKGEYRLAATGRGAHFIENTRVPTLY
jgi:hypothetical protein